ncbi:hypothetical protein [Sedimentitalea sp.]|uniref:hypothetical protein n=1 Tax=Sedimentitalea sp. TaxID=2048915 RepID=UPI00329A756A
MTDLPPIERTQDEKGPLVQVGDTEMRSFAELLKAAPQIADPKYVQGLAYLANHLSYGFDYSVIDSPGDFEEEYRARMAQEDATAPMVPGVVRLIDYGVPDFAEVAPPALEGDTLRFFAVASTLGFPYAVTVNLASGDTDYAPMTLTRQA